MIALLAHSVSLPFIAVAVVPFKAVAIHLLLKLFSKTLTHGVAAVCTS